MSAFDSEAYSFVGLLGRASFQSIGINSVVVPPFQRGYSWKKEQVATFWDDVGDLLKGDPSTGATDNYFLGPIVYRVGSDCIHLLDGQQRLATATILFAVIRM